MSALTSAVMNAPTGPVTLRGYRATDESLLRGGWAAGELLGLPVPGRPALVPPAAIDPPQDRDGEVCVVPGAGAVRFAEIDWVHRRARLEIGLADGAAKQAGPVLEAALEHGFSVLNLARLYGWVTPAARPRLDLLCGAGLEREAVVPQAGWLAGRPVARELWGVLRTDHPARTMPESVEEFADPVSARPDGAHLELLDAAAAAAALLRADATARGFLDLDPVTMNAALLARSLTRAGAQVFGCGDAVLGYVPNAGQPRQVTVATTSPDPGPLRALLGFLSTYRRCTSFVAMATPAAPTREALRGCGFAPIGRLVAHRFQTARFLDVEVHYASEGAARCE